MSLCRHAVTLVAIEVAGAPNCVPAACSARQLCSGPSHGSASLTIPSSVAQARLAVPRGQARQRDAPAVELEVVLALLHAAVAGQEREVVARFVGVEEAFKKDEVRAGRRAVFSGRVHGVESDAKRV